MKYRYSGPTSGVTLQKGEEAQEVMLHTGAEVDLPEEHEYTKTLLGAAPEPDNLGRLRDEVRTELGTS